MSAGPALGGGYAFTNFNDPQATGNTYATGINNGGQLAGDDANSTGYHGFVETQSGFTTLNDPAVPTETVADAINDADQVVGYLWTGTSWQGFPHNGSYSAIDDPLASAGTLVWGLNNAGQIVGTTMSARRATVSSN